MPLLFWGSSPTDKNICRVSKREDYLQQGLSNQYRNVTWLEGEHSSRGRDYFVWKRNSLFRKFRNKKIIENQGAFEGKRNCIAYTFISTKHILNHFVKCPKLTESRSVFSCYRKEFFPITKSNSRTTCQEMASHLVFATLSLVTAIFLRS